MVDFPKFGHIYFWKNSQKIEILSHHVVNYSNTAVMHAQNLEILLENLL